MKLRIAPKPYVVLGALLALIAASFGRLGEAAQERRIGLIEDWSMRHVVFARIGPAATMMAAQRDPRAFFSWHKAALAAARFSRESVPQSDSGPQDEFFQFRWFHGKRLPPPKLHTDWSISLGTRATASAMSPAKFSFDVNATPSCANDFVVFPVNHAPDPLHENLVAFNNLYSGTVPANGICNRTPSLTDDGVSATVLWSYAISSSISAGVSTSPVLSLDGTKVAFVESEAGKRPHFHVLAWKSGDGVNPTNLQDAQLPLLVSTFSSSAPAAGSGTATNLAFGAASGGDTLSSPYVDYAADKAYVGDDQGNLVRIKDIFCTVSVACSGATPPAPSIDTTWGTAGTVMVGPGSCAGTANSKLTGPVQDSITGNVYVGCADGKLYGFNSSGSSLATPSVTVGNGSAHGGIVDPPVVDGVNGFVYAVSGVNGRTLATCGIGSCPVLVQTKVDLTSPLAATLGGQANINIHAPTFNDAYFSNMNSTTWLIYVQGYNGGGNHTRLYAAGFDAGRNLVTGTPPNSIPLRSIAVETSPFTEFLNAGTDRLFLSLIAHDTLDAFNINAFPAGTSATVTETGGTSGIIVDDVSAQNQASSIYFATLAGSHAAVKVTQAALQ
jgi:hypothetical protein